MRLDRAWLNRNFLLALAAAAFVLLWQGLTVRYNYGGNWTALYFTGDRFAVPPALKSGTFLFKNSYGYDGQFYRYIAHDPFFQYGYSSYVDDPRLRYRRIFLPMAAFLVAGARQDTIDAAYIAIVLLATLAGVYWSSLYAATQGCHFGWGLIFLLSPGALTSIDRLLTDGLLTALFAGVLVYSSGNDVLKLFAILTLAALTRETGFLLIAGAAGAEFFHKRYQRGLLFAAASLPALIWYAFVSLHTKSSAESAMRIFTFPGAGLVARMFTVRPFADPVLRVAVPVLDLLTLLGFIASLALALRWIWKPGLSQVAITIGLFVVLGLVAGSPDHLLEGYGYSRPLSPLLLFVMLRAVAEGAWLALIPPLLVTASVAVFFVSPALTVLKALL